MKRIIFTLLLVPMLTLLPMAGIMEPAYAACGNSQAAKDVSKGIGQTGTTPSDCGQGAINNVIRQAVSILSILVGAAAVIAIIWGGFKYITSGGDSGKVGNAKSTLLYAVIGLAVAVVAQVIVNFVITESNNAVNCQPGYHVDASGKCVKNKS
jgi:Type IV secretion system pilin